MEAFQLKIVVKHSKPPIWRRCIVPSGLTFAQLGIVLNKVMGWSGYHQSVFEFYHLGLHLVEDVEAPGIGYYYDYADAATTYAREYMEDNEWFTYIYDSGDSWTHRVTIEKVISDYAYNYPQVIKFKGVCPIEDRGGAEFQGYQEEYDMQAINEELKRECFLIWGEGETRRKRDIYENFSAGIYGLQATKSDKNKTKPTRSKRHIFEDTMKLFLENLSDRAGSGGNVNPRSLKAIFLHFKKKEVIELAEEKGIPDPDEYEKEQLCEALSRKMLEPEEVERYFSCLSESELVEFVQAWEGDSLLEERGALHKLYAASYIGVLENGRVSIPEDVYAAYLKIKTREFEEKRKTRSWLMACFDVAEVLYGIVSAGVMVKLFNKGEGQILSPEELIQEAGEIPECLQKFVYVKGMFYHRMLYPDDRNIILCQGQMDFYIPSREEIMDMQEYGYFSRDKHLEVFIQYLIKERGVEKEEAARMRREIQLKLCADHSLKEVMDTLLFGGLMLEGKEARKELLAALRELQKNTRMLLNRGFTSAELSAGGRLEARPAFLTVLDGGKSRSMHTTPKKTKKNHPNE